MDRTDEDRAVRKWQHRPGDEYIVIATSMVGTPRSGYGFDYCVYPRRHLSRPEAQSYGFTIGRSDDFNIGVLRREELVAVLWMDEIVDDEPDDIAEVASAVRAAL